MRYHHSPIGIAAVQLDRIVVSCNFVNIKLISKDFAATKRDGGSGEYMFQLCDRKCKKLEMAAKESRLFCTTRCACRGTSISATLNATIAIVNKHTP